MMLPNYEILNEPVHSKLLLHVEWNDELLPFFSRYSIKYLSLRKHHGFKWESLSFLSKLSWLRGFELLAPLTENIAAIHSLHELEELSLNEYSHEAIDFSAFPNLRECSIFFSKNRKSVSNCVRLTKLHLQGYSYKDLSRLTQLAELNTLDMTRGSLTDVSDLIAFQNLRVLDLALLRNLTDISPIASLPKLEVLRITSCKGFNNLEFLQNSANLKALELSNCGELESLSPITNCKNLEVVAFTEGTTFRDGSVSELLKLPRLQRVGFTYRDHYDMTRDEVVDRLDQRLRQIDPRHLF